MTTKLIGSEKQIVWAESIRTSALAKVEAWDSGITALIAAPPEGTAPERLAQVKEMYEASAARIAAMRTIELAAWWIDNRTMLEQDAPALVRALNLDAEIGAIVKGNK